MEEVPGPEASLLALDEQPALAGQNEERLLIRLGVLDAALAPLENRDVDPELRELDRRLAVLALEVARRSPAVRDHHSASRTLTTNQPSVTGASPEPESSSRASATTRFSQPKRHLPDVGQCAGMSAEREPGARGVCLHYRAS